MFQQQRRLRKIKIFICQDIRFWNGADWSAALL